MKIVYVVYSDESYKEAKSFAIKTAKYLGKFDKVYAFSPQDIDEGFRQKNAEAFLYERGAGLWLWKPYIVKRVLDEVEYGDIVFYADAGCFFFRSVHHIVRQMRQDIWVCDIPLEEQEFTKDICFQKLNAEEHRFSPQRIATFFAVRKSNNSCRIIQEWLDYCQDLKLLEPADYKGNCISHREDQSLFSLVTKIHGIVSHQSPTIAESCRAFNYFRGSKLLQLKHSKEYPACIVLHKQRRVTCWIIMKNLILLFFPAKLLNIIMDKAKLPPPVTHSLPALRFSVRQLNNYYPSLQVVRV